MRRFIAYFDLLGFKSFIFNNDLDCQRNVMKNIFRDIESSLGSGKLIVGKKHAITDISGSNINCINFSDTIVFWTNDDSIDSLKEIIDVAYKFNKQSIFYSFPVRGCIILGDIVHIDFRQKNIGGGVYNLNSIYGKGVVDAYLKAENQNWAGTVIDNSVIDYLNNVKINSEEYLTRFAKKYYIPYKCDEFYNKEEYALSLVEDEINDVSYFNLSKRIESNFYEHKKINSDLSVIKKIENTLKFLETHKKQK